MFSSDDARRELVPISPDRWPAAVGTELAEVSVFLQFPELSNIGPPGLGPETSQTPAGGGQPRAQTERFDKCRGFSQKMHPRL